MGFFKDLKDMKNRREQRRKEREQRKKEVNQNPTEEQLKDNKKGKLAYLWTFLSIIAYVGGFGIVFAAWQNNIAVGIMALIFVLMVTPLVHTKAVNLAKEQRRINGKGLVALILASLLPAIILAAGFFFFVFGGFYSLL